MSKKKEQHKHSFGTQCQLCLKNHPEAHQRHDRLPRKQRLGENIRKKELANFQ